MLCYRAEHWRSLHTIYEGLKRRADIITTVIRVPYYKVGYDSVVDMDHMIIESEGYPDGIEFTEYDKYDFEGRHPSAVIIQSPYDEFHCDICTHPFYHSKNLYKYTDRLILIPPFVTREPKDVEKLKKTMAMFLDNPGAIYADKIIVQSESTRESYIEILEEFLDKELSVTNDDDMKLKPQDIMDLSEKVVAAGSAVYDWESRSRVLLRDSETGEIYDKHGKSTAVTLFDQVYDVPGDVISGLRKPDGSFKKIIVFYISGSMVFSFGKGTLDKMREVLYKLTDNEDLFVWWFMDPYAREILKRYDKEAWVAFRRLRDDFAGSGLGLLDESRDDSLIRNIADMMYGDAGELMNYIREKGRPVMWETPGVSLDQESGEHLSWKDDTIMAIEGDWCLDAFIKLSLEYENSNPKEGNAERIIKEILD